MGENVATPVSNEEGEGAKGEEVICTIVQTEGGVSGDFDTLIKQVAYFKKKKKIG